MATTVTGPDIGGPYAQGPGWVPMVVGLDELAWSSLAGTGWLEAMELEPVERTEKRGLKGKAGSTLSSCTRVDSKMSG